MVEGADTSSQKIQIDFADALRRAVAGQKKNAEGEVTRPKASKRESAPSSEGGRNARGESRSASNRRTNFRLNRRRGGDELSRRPVVDDAVGARVQNKVEPVTDWKKVEKAEIPFARVPYAVPKVDLASLKEGRTKQNTSKTWHPLKEANRSLTLSSGRDGDYVLGNSRQPTPIARPGLSLGVQLLNIVKRDTGSDDGKQTVSIAKEAREARIQKIKEDVGGDYSRFDAKKFVIGKGELANEVAQAVAINDDMAPTHKRYVAENVHQILNKTGP